MKQDFAFRNACHKRWVSRIVRDLDAKAPDYWYAEQCVGCAAYLRLHGELGEDWGVCGNAASPYDGVLKFEHDGCEHHIDLPDHD